MDKFKFFTFSKEDIYLRRSLGTMILAGIGVITFSLYGKNYPINITDEEAELAVFSKDSK
ncbi:hypothetical protein GNF80_02300 [Clostridium perfringens]|nr:hypothetical protein [Clostridium perfringens]